MKQTVVVVVKTCTLEGMTDGWQKKVLTEDEAQEMREVMKPIFHTQVIQGSELLKRVRDATREYMGFC